MVRGVGPGLPLRGPRPRRSGLRQVPARPVVPRVVPAPQRRAAGLRVGLQRREPAGAGVGRARGVRHRRGHRRRLPQPRVRQAARELHLVGEPAGRVGLQPVRGRLPRPRQHRPARPLAPPGRGNAPAVGRHRVDGDLRAGHGGDRVHPEPVGQPSGERPRAQVPRALRGHPPGDGRPRGVGRDRRPLLRQAGHPGRHGRAGEGAVDGRHHPAARRGGGGGADAGPGQDPRQAVHPVPRRPGAGRR